MPLASNLTEQPSGLVQSVGAEVGAPVAVARGVAREALGERVRCALGERSPEQPDSLEGLSRGVLADVVTERRVVRPEQPETLPVVVRGCGVEPRLVPRPVRDDGNALLGVESGERGGGTLLADGLGSVLELGSVDARRLVVSGEQGED